MAYGDDVVGVGAAGNDVVELLPPVRTYVGLSSLAAVTTPCFDDAQCSTKSVVINKAVPKMTHS